MRNINVISSRTNGVKPVQSSASTWGDLKADLIAAGLDVSNMTAIVRETRNNLAVEDAKLPEGNFSLFLMAEKKAGAITSKKKVVAKSKPTSKLVTKSDSKDYDLDKLLNLPLAKLQAIATKEDVKVRMKVGKADPSYTRSYARTLYKELAAKYNLGAAISKAPTTKEVKNEVKEVPKQKENNTKTKAITSEPAKPSTSSTKEPSNSQLLAEFEAVQAAYKRSR